MPEPVELPRAGAPAGTRQSDAGQRHIGQACPRLGLSGDPASHAIFVTPIHRCYAMRREKPIAPDHQAAFCLSRYESCLIYRAGNAAGKTPGLSLSVNAPRPSLVLTLRRWLWLALLLALLGAIGADVLGRGQLRHSILPIVVITVAAAILAVTLLVFTVAALLQRRLKGIRS
ncbi:MAG: hypothetical protein M1118_02295 [Chloroflexi bacterium]|nr:hypothetical protein [Chloroflexota bacterium]